MEVFISLSMIRKFYIWLVHMVILLPLIFYILITYLFFVGGILSLL